MNEEDLSAEDEMIAEGAPTEPDPMDQFVLLETELAQAQQQILYAQAETQNVRRRLEKRCAGCPRLRRNQFCARYLVGG
jgi:molecular chaperone GrpE (heat shock protein)